MTNRPGQNNLTATATSALSSRDELNPSGSAVWLNMDQQALDNAYDQSRYPPNRSQILERCATNSKIVRERLSAPRRIAYGPTANEMLDLYPAATTNAPISILCMGGAGQRAFAKDMFSRPNCSCVLARIILCWTSST